MAMDPEQLAEANRQMVAERQDLLRQLREAQTTNAQRAVLTVAEVVDGLAQLQSQAARGDMKAKALLVSFARLMKAAIALDSGILTPGRS